MYLSNIGWKYDDGVSEEFNEYEIDPIIYVKKFFERLRFEVDLIIEKKVFSIDKQSRTPTRSSLIQKEIAFERRNKILKILKDLEEKCVDNCRRNFFRFQENFADFVKKRKYILNEICEDRSINEDLIRETNAILIDINREMFVDNIVFISEVAEYGNLFFGSLLIIQPFLFDQFQIKILK